MSSRSRAFLAAAVALVVLACVGVAVAVAEDPEHEHPDEIEDEDDLEAVQRWLGDRMGRVHVDCTEGMRVGNFDACEDLDEEYESYLERYVTVERETSGGGDDEPDGERFEETREQQAELASLLEEFWATHDDYTEARQRGDEAEARANARQLLSLAERIEALGGDLSVNFRFLDEQVSGDLNASADAVDETTEEVVTIRSDVEQESFVATELSAAIDGGASFESPAAVSGSLEDDDGDPIAGATIVIEDDETNTTVQTDQNGEFAGEYAPTATEAGETNVTVRYVPSPDSVYLGSHVNATVDVQQAPSTVRVTDATAEAGFGDTITATGVVEGADRAAPGVPVTLLVDDRAVATNRTDEDGSFTVSAAMPAEVPAGDAEVTVRASEENRALEPSEERSTMTVTETATALNVSATQFDDRVRITGALVADGDAPVGQRPVEVTVGEETRTVATDPNGSYAVVVEPPEEDPTVSVAYDEPETNLGSSTASTTIPGLEPSDDPGRLGKVAAAIGDLAEAYPGLAIGAVAALLSVAAAARALLGRREHPDATVEPADTDAPGAAGVANAQLSQSYLDRARKLLASAPDEAVKASYAAVRTGLGGEDPVRTHWEFYNDRTADLPAEREDALRALTESFERATFARRGLDRADAEAAVADAERCLAASDGGTSDSND